MIAGGLGAGARYGLTLLIQYYLEHGFLRNLSPLGAHFPLGTLVINISGSFLLALITILALQGAVPPELSLIIGTGFVGAFTTFSTFELESHGLLSSGEWTQAMIYIFGNLLFGFIAVILGGMLAMKMIGGHLGNP